MSKSLLFLIAICAALFICGCTAGNTTPTQPPVATHFSVTPATVSPAAGTQFNFTVTALDSSNTIVSNYSGTIHFISSDAKAVLPADSPITNGTGSFSATLKTAGSQTITASAIFNSTSSAIIVSAGPASQVSVRAPATAQTRRAFTVTVNALDVYGNVATSYSGTVRFTSTDPTAVLPSNSPLPSGTGNFLATVSTVGPQTITATDTLTSSLANTSGPIAVFVGTGLAIRPASPPKGTVNVDYGPTITEEEVCSRVDRCGPCFGAECQGLPRCGAGVGYPCTIFAPVFVGFTFRATGGIQPYTWSTSSLPPGLSVDASNGEILGTPTKFGVYPNIGVTVTDSGSPAATVAETVSITIFAPPLQISSSSLLDGVIGTAYSAPLTTSGGTNPVTWSVNAGALPPGLNLSPDTGTITGTPTSEGYFTFTLQAADSSTPQLTATQALAITVNPPAANNAELNGQYAFSLRGFETNGPAAVVGTFTADGKGNLTNGLRDVTTGQGVTASQAFVGTYEIFADNRGIFKLMTSPGGTDLGTFRFAVGSISAGVADKGRFINFNPSVSSAPNQGSGLFEKQDATAFLTSKIAGDFAFGLSADDFGAAGRFTASAGTISSGALDEDDQGALTSNAAFTGTYSVAPTGRGTMTLNITGIANPLSLVFYVVSSGELLIQNGDPGVHSLFSGTIVGQSGAGTFSDASLNSATVVALSGRTVTGSTDVVLGLLNFPSVGNFLLTGDENNGGTIQTLNQSGTYSVMSNGRVTIIGATKPVVYYLAGANRGFVVGTDANPTTGFFEAQTGAPFSTASATGPFFFGVIPFPPNFASAYKSGDASFDGAGTVTETFDFNGLWLFPNQALTDTYAISATGRGTLASSGDIFYLISPSKYVLTNGTPGAAFSSITEGEK